MTAPSTEKVIAEMLNDLHMIASQGETPDGDGVTVNVQLWAERWIDRLSTPAAGDGRGKWLQLLGDLVCAGRARDWSADDQNEAISKAHNALYAYLRQLQARNAEQAEKIERAQRTASNRHFQVIESDAMCADLRDRAEAAESRYTALAAGIEGLATRWEKLAEQHGVRQFTGNDHLLFANELRVALKGVTP